MRQAGSSATQQAGDDRHRPRRTPARAPSIDDVVHSRKIDRRGPDEQVQPLPRDQHAERAAGCRQQQLFEHDPADEPRAAGAECASNRGLAHPAERPRQRQVRQVRAGDQHDAADRAEQQQQPEPCAADDRLRRAA